MVGCGQAQGVYQFTQSHANQISSMDYNKIIAETLRSDGGPPIHTLVLLSHQPPVPLTKGTPLFAWLEHLMTIHSSYPGNKNKSHANTNH